MSSFLWQWTLQDDCMMILLGCFSCIRITNHLPWLMSDQRNRTSFVSLDLRVVFHTDSLFQTCRSRTDEDDTCRPTPLRTTRVVPHRFWLLPLYFFLRVLPKRHILIVLFHPFIGYCAHHSYSVTPSFPWPSTFFYSDENKHIKSTIIMKNTLLMKFITSFPWYRSCAVASATAVFIVMIRLWCISLV